MRLHRTVLAFIVVALVGSAHAADPIPNSSLKLIPADAAFYTTSLHLGEQMEMFIKSNAFAKLQSLPVMKLAATHVHEEAGKADNPFGPIMKAMKDPANQELAGLLADLPNREIFVYGGAGWTDLLPLLMELSSVQRFVPLQAIMNPGADPSKAQARAVLQTLNDSAAKIVFPEIVIGFKLSQAAPAIAQIKRLETLLTQATANVAPLKGSIKRTKVGGADALTFSLDGSLIPMDKIPWSEIEEQEGQYQKLRARLKALTFTVSLLVKNDYLLLTVGPSAQVAAKLGSGSSLATLPEMAPLAKFADRKIVSASYSSKALAATVATTPKDIMDLVDLAKNGLDRVPLSEKLRTSIDKDLKKLAAEASATLPKPGAAMGFSFLSDRGQESYAYNYGTSPDGVAAKPLAMLEHLGGSPIIALAGPVGDPLPAYQSLVKWIKIVYGHVDAAAQEVVPQFYPSVQQSLDIVLPILKKFDEITSGQFLPALGAGEIAFVLDANWTSKQWHKDLDQGGKELPMAEIGVVRTVADAAKLVKAFQAYRDLVNEIITKANDFGAGLPDGGLPKPETKKSAAGTAYFWPIPPVGQDQQILPNVALSDKLIAFGLSLKQTDRLLTPTPLKTESSLLAKNRPATLVGVVDFGGMIAAARPWIEQMALPAILAQMPDNAPPGAGKKDIPAQVKTVLDVIACLRTFTSVTYKEGDVTVTHGVLVIQDLK